MKKIITLVIVVLFSVYFIACDKVHDAPSRLRIGAIGVSTEAPKESSSGGDEEDETEYHWSLGLDLFGGTCIDPEDQKYTAEPFYDSYVNFVIRNYFKFHVTLTHYYYIIKDYYGNGNDYVSPNLGLIGNTVLVGNGSDEASSTDLFGNTSNKVPQDVVYGIFLPTSGECGRRLPGSQEIVQEVGTKNIEFHVFARADNGKEIETTRTMALTLKEYSACPSGYLYYSCRK